MMAPASSNKQASDIQKKVNQAIVNSLNAINRIKNGKANQICTWLYIFQIFDLISGFMRLEIVYKEVDRSYLSFSTSLFQFCNRLIQYN